MLIWPIIFFIAAIVATVLSLNFSRRDYPASNVCTIFAVILTICAGLAFSNYTARQTEQQVYDETIETCNQAILNGTMQVDTITTKHGDEVYYTCKVNWGDYEE